MTPPLHVCSVCVSWIVVAVFSTCVSVSRCVSISPVALTRHLSADMLDEVVGLGAVTVLGVLEQGERTC